MAVTGWLSLSCLLANFVAVYCYSHIGCYVDNGNERDLLDLAESSNSMSPARCNQLCSNRKFLFYGLQNARECWCGNSYGRHWPVSSGECNKRCTGDNSATCGSDWRNDVYGTDFGGSVQIRYIGCFLDNGNNRDLPYRAAHDHLITLPRCYELCSAKNYIYFGLQNSDECWCGNDYGKHGAKPERECSKRCSGENGALCGNNDRNSVYATGHRFLPLPASSDPVPKELTSDLAASLRSQQVPFPAGVLCTTCLIASWNRRFADVKTRKFNVNDMNTVMSAYPNKVKEKVMSLQFGAKTTFEDEQMQIFGNYAVRGCYLGMARRVGDQIEMAITTSEVAGYLVPKHHVFTKQSCSGWWFWTKCNTETIRERIGYTISDVELIEKALRSETFKLASEKL